MTETKSYDIQLEERAGQGRYFIEFPGGLEAEMTFARHDGVMAIDHTGVPPALEGRGIAAALVQRAIDDARRDKFKIRPICSYVVVAFQRHKEWADLLA